MADEIKRRDFLKLVGLGGAATVLSNCTQPVEKVIPYLVKEEEITPGVSTYFATVCRECPAGCGMIVRTREGRALKAEGNPLHPVNQGKLCMRGQASVQGLYNPDRFRGPQRVLAGKFTPVSWDEALKEFTEKLKAAKAKNRPGNVAYLGGLSSGTFSTLVSDFLNAVGSPGHAYVYEPLSYEPLRTASRQTFGIEAVPTYDFSQADVVVSFGADFLETWLSPVEYARQFAQIHGFKNGKLGKAYYVGPRLSLTAANADKWLAIKPGHELPVALAVLNVIVSRGLAKQELGTAKAVVAKYVPASVAQAAGISENDIVNLAETLAAAPTSLVVAGPHLAGATALAAAVNLINFALGNIGKSVNYAVRQTQGAATADLRVLIERMARGEIEVLVIHDVNPAFSLPLVAKWNEAIAKVPFVVMVTSHPSETAAQAHLVLAAHTPYEQWNDYVPRDGVYGLMQPVMRPVFDTRHPGDILLAGAQAVTPGAGGFGAYEDYLRNAWQARHREFGAGKSFDVFFNEALQKGGVWRTATASVAVKLAPEAASIAVPAELPQGKVLVAYPTIQFYDGRLANRPWMQETPDVMTKLTWGSWVEIHPETAKALSLSNGDVVTLETSAGTLEAPAYIYRGVVPGVFAIPVGQGHTSASGRYAGASQVNKGHILPGDGTRGVNPLTVVDGAFLANLKSVSKTGRSEMLLSTSGSDSQHDREIIQVVPLAQVGMLAQRAAEMQREIDQAKARLRETLTERGLSEKEIQAQINRPVVVGTIENRVRGQLGEEPGPNTFPPHEHAEHRWGMAIDLSACIGCGACAVACYAENNVPVVGPTHIGRGREMAWLWIERYFLEEPGVEGRAEFIPMLCQHCDNAPCETVCPVYATYHNPEGLNAQVYNRCVGTRYCGNNCPYKVRRFNWYDYEWPAPLEMQLNPDVTVRTKGVMEKCTFCVQRIRAAKDRARDEGRPVRDGEIVTACQQTCPTDAIIFGDLKDPNSRVAQLTRDPRGYRVLDDLNTQSAITYLRAVVHEQES